MSGDYNILIRGVIAHLHGSQHETEEEPPAVPGPRRPIHPPAGSPTDSQHPIDEQHTIPGYYVPLPAQPPMARMTSSP